MKVLVLVQWFNLVYYCVVVSVTIKIIGFISVLRIWFNNYYISNKQTNEWNGQTSRTLEYSILYVKTDVSMTFSLLL